jgi:xylonate dehydratase
VRDGDTIEIVIDRATLAGSVNLAGEAETPSGENRQSFDANEGARRLALRQPRPDLAPHPELPDDTRLWAALVTASGGVWGGCVYDADMIINRLERNS